MHDSARRVASESLCLLATGHSRERRRECLCREARVQGAERVRYVCIVSSVREIGRLCLSRIALNTAGRNSSDA